MKDEVGKHLDDGKPRWDLLPLDAVEGVVKILTYGTKKYASRNWELGIDYSKIYGSTMRHLKAWFQDREDIDPESGLPHINHAACDILFLAAYVARHMRKFDDRPHTGRRRK